jgi:prophage regulatory protein
MNNNSYLPETGFLRLPQIIGNRKSTPPIPAIIPVSKSTWWAGVKSGIYPKPIKLGPRVSVWRVSDIRKLIEGMASRPVHPNLSSHLF